MSSMKIIILSVLFTLFSFGQDRGKDPAQPPKLVIDNTDSAQEAKPPIKALPLDKAMESIVKVFFYRSRWDSHRKYRLYCKKFKR